MERLNSKQIRSHSLKYLQNTQNVNMDHRQIYDDSDDDIEIVIFISSPQKEKKKIRTTYTQSIYLKFFHDQKQFTFVRFVLERKIKEEKQRNERKKKLDPITSRAIN